MKFLTDFTYRNLHGFARFPSDSMALVITVCNLLLLADVTTDAWLPVLFDFANNSYL